MNVTSLLSIFELDDDREEDADEDVVVGVVGAAIGVVGISLSTTLHSDVDEYLLNSSDWVSLL